MTEPTPRQTTPPEAEAQTPETKKKRAPVEPKRIIVLAVALVLFLVVTNPALIPFLPADVKASLSNIWGSLFGDVSGIAKTVIINWVTIFKLIAMGLLLSLISTVARFVLEHISPKSGKGKSARSMLLSALSYVVAIVAAVWGLTIIGVSVSTILASVGIVTLIIGFGAESLVADVISGLFLVFENQFNVGDIIEVAGFRGEVKTIGVRTTAIQDVGGNIKLINNGDIRNVLNRSEANSKAVTTVSVAYAEPLEKVEAVLAKVLPVIRETYPDTFLSDPVYVGVQQLGSSGVELKIVAEVHEDAIFKAPRLMNREIKLAFDREGIEIPFTQVVVHSGDKK